MASNIMTDEDELRARYFVPGNTSAIKALKVVTAAQAARDAALAAYVEAERRLYDAQEEMKAVRLINKGLH